MPFLLVLLQLSLISLLLFSHALLSTILFLLLLIIFLGTHFTHALGFQVSRLRREGHTNPSNRLRKRLGMIKIQILYTCSPVTLTEVEGGISEQSRNICVSNSQDIFYSTLSWRMNINVKLSVTMCGEGRQRGRRDNIQRLKPNFWACENKKPRLSPCFPWHRR